LILLALNLDGSGCRGVDAKGIQRVMTEMWIARAKKRNKNHVYIKYTKKNRSNIPPVSTRSNAGLFPNTSTRHIVSHGAKKMVSTRIMGHRSPEIRITPDERWPW